MKLQLFLIFALIAGYVCRASGTTAVIKACFHISFIGSDDWLGKRNKAIAPFVTAERARDAVRYLLCRR